MKTMQDLLEKYEELKPAKIGEIVEGSVIGKGRSSIFLDLGPTGTGIIFGREFYDSKRQLKNLETGDTVCGKVVDLETEKGFIELSVRDAFREMTFESLQERKDAGELISVEILGANKGGLMAKLMGVDSFLPVSQLANQHYPKVEGGDRSEILRKLQSFIGEEFTVKILNLFPQKNQIILSERAKDIDRMKKILDQYNIGDMIDGEITGITNFGAFIKFPLSVKSEQEQLEGLIHISELDWKIVKDPSEIIQIADKVKAKIIDISKGKISLSLKSLKEDPWKGMDKKYPKGAIVSGSVSKVNSFGVFVEVTEGIRALCHISEFEEKAEMMDQLDIGKKYKFEVLSVDEKEHRMSLKLIK